MNLKEFQVVTWAIRQKMLCSKVREYLVKHPRATIIDISCGLSTGFSEVDNVECKWVNLDYRIAFYMRLNSCNIFKINKGQTLFI